MSSVITPRSSSTAISVRGEVVTDRPDHADVGEKAGRQGEVDGGSAEHALAFPERSGYGVEGDRADNGQRQGGPFRCGLRTPPSYGHSECENEPVKAIQITEFGGPEVLELVELPDPEPGAGETVVTIAPDRGQLRRYPCDPQRLPGQAELCRFIPGVELTGVNRRRSPGRRGCSQRSLRREGRGAE